jgi:hypothetical protein
LRRIVAEEKRKKEKRFSQRPQRSIAKARKVSEKRRKKVS